MKNLIKYDINTSIKINKIREIKNSIDINRHIHREFLEKIWDSIDAKLEEFNLKSNQKDDIYSLIYDLQNRSEVLAFQLAVECQKSKLDFVFLLNNFDNEYDFFDLND